MKQKFLSRFKLRALMLVTLLCAGFTSAWADDVYYTLDGTITGGTNNYASESEITQDNIKWMVTGNTTMSPWRIGGKSLSNVDRTAYSVDAMGSAISKVDLTVGTATLTVNSIKLVVASDASFNNVLDEVTATFTASSTISFVPSTGTEWATGAYYKFVFNVSVSGSSNKFVEFSKAEFYKSASSSSSPSISADNVDIAYDSTSGSIAYTLANEVTGGSLSAEVTAGNWLTLGTGTTSPISFTCSANTAAAERTATVTLTYTYGTENVTKNVTVTQAGNPNIVDNISDITAAGTYTVQGTIVAKSTRGFIVGDGTGYVYYYNQSYDQSAYNIGDKVKLSGSVVAYGGVFEFNNSTTVSATTESNYVAENPSVLSGGDMDTRVGSSDAQLSSYVQYQGTLTVSGTYYNITSIDGATTAMGSISYPINTDWSSLNGKTVTVKGYYVGVSSSKYYNTMLESIEEVVATTPTITATAASLTGFTYEVGNGPSAAQQITIGGLNLTNCWSASLDANSNFEYSFDENDGYFSDSGIGANPSEPNQSVVIYVRMKSGLAVGDYNEAITITSQGAETVTVNLSGSVTAPVVDYATLPFIFDGGKADIENTDGLTQSGLDSDYGSSPKLKFNGADDVVVLKINEAPGTLTFDIKGNSFSGGTFKVQTSEDGTTYTDLKTYTELGDTQNESFNNLGVNVRYIKWIYTEKISGNVALGNITLAKTAAPSAPVWSALPTPTISVGEDYELNLADYVSGYPTPTISITTGGDIASIDANNYFHFTPTAEGYKEFVLFASNDEGGMEAILAVTVTAAVPSVEVSETAINAPADASDGTITVTYHNITLANLLSDVKFYEADGTTETTSYGWIDAEIDNQNNVYYIIDQNTDTNARTAYMKVWARDDNNNDVYSDLITITQAGNVVDYATLPFEWTTGTASELAAVTGVTANGLGSDYAANNAPYRIKFDTTGDYIQVKTNERPGFVTISVKMIGGATASSITVQGSADGTTFTDVQELTISGSQNDVLELTTTNVFAETDRYVRLYFTKGSNVGVGPISIAQYTAPSTDPVINALDVNITAAATEGEIAYTITRPVTGVTLTATSTDAWIENINVEADKVTFNCDPNTGDERTATITLSYTGAADKVITVTQGAYVAPFTPVTYTLATAITSGKHYIIVGENNGAYQAMGEQKSNNRAAYDVTVENGTATVSTADVKEVVIYGPTTDDSYTIYDAEADGYLYAASGSSNYLRTEDQFDANGVWRITFDASTNVASIVARGSNTHNVMQYNSGNSSLFSCYGSASQKPIYLYEKDGDTPVAADYTRTATIGSYGTICLRYKATIAGVNLFSIDGVDNVKEPKALSLEAVYVAQAGVPYIFKATASTINAYYTGDEATTAGSANGLIGSFTKENITDANGDPSTLGENPYVLKNNKVCKAGVNVSVGANKAYINLNDVPTSTGSSPVKMFIDADADGIDMVQGSMDNAEFYDLAGRRVIQPRRGIYIVNGKKVLVK